LVAGLLRFVMDSSVFDQRITLTKLTPNRLATLAIEQAGGGKLELLFETEAKIDDIVFDCFNLSSEEKIAVLEFWSLKKSVVQNLEFDEATD
jgi:hypothetical protein